MSQITIADLTIRQAKTLGKAVGVPGFSKMIKGDLVQAIRMKVADEETLQRHVDAMLTTEEKRRIQSGEGEKMSSEQAEQARFQALKEIALAAGKRMKAEDALRGRRQELNQEVSEAKTSHKGAMERDVDYADAESVRSKLEDVTFAWQAWQDSLEHRRVELDPLKEALSKARTAERKAFENSKQLRIQF